MTLILNGTDNSATTPAVTGTDTDTGIYYPTSNQVAISTAGTQAMLVNASQNVGIGTASPNYKLNVGDTSSVTTLNGVGLTLFSSTTLTSNIGGVLNFRPGLGQTASDIFNLSICAYDHSGDTNADGLSINGSDGVSFSTGGNSRNERMRIDSSGNLLVGTTTLSNDEKVTIRQSAASVGISVRSAGSALGNYESSDINHNAYWTFGRDNASTGNFVFASGGTLRGSISSTTGVYTPSSDSRLKKNITNITYGLNEVMALRPVTYLMNEEADTAKKHLGFIAQEVKALVDEAVDDLIDPDTQFYMLDKAGLVPVLVKAMQELKAEFDAYKAAHP
jgi:hypothetical protein